MASMFVTLGSFGRTHVDTVDATARVYDPPGVYSEFVVLTDTDTHIKIVDSSTPALATTADFLLLAGCYARVECDQGQAFSWVVGASVVDGTIRITEASLP